MSEHIEGIITRLVKGTPKANRWFAGSVRLSDGSYVRVAGTANVRVNIGMTIEFNGDLVSTNYGDQYEPVSGELIRRRLVTKFEIISFLTSSVFPGIGEKSAKLIYEKYKDQTMPMLEQHMDQVIADCKLNKSQAAGLVKGISSTSGLAKLKYTFPHMKQYLLDRILDAVDVRHLDDVVDRICRNPYTALYGDTGFNVSLYDTDEIALLDVGFDEYAKERIDLVVYAALSEFMGDKNATYVKIDYDHNFAEYTWFFNKYVRAVRLFKPLPIYWDGMLFDANCLAMKFQQYWDDIHSFSSCVCSDRRINPDGTGEFDLYQKKIYLAEKSLVEQINRSYNDTMNTAYMKRTVKFVQWYKAMKAEGVYTNTNPDQDQVAAVRQVFGSCMSFLSGGPGRGKTATIGFLINAWKHSVGNHILLLAPTGKAVNKVKDATKYVNAETIRRFILINKLKRTKDSDYILDMYGDKMPIGLNTLVVIDETSMLDFVEASDLLSVIDGCTIVFSGDKDQLSPISPGSFLSEMLDSHKINLSLLTHNYRTDVPELGENADKILAGCKATDLTLTDNFSIIPSKERADDGGLSPAEKYILNEYADRMAEGADFSDILVVAPFTNSKYGLSAGHLNYVLQARFNPQDDKAYYKYGQDDYGRYIDKRGKECPVLDKSGNRVRLGDRVINNRNNMDASWHSFKNDNVGYESSLDDPIDSAINTGVFNGDMGTIERYYEATDSDGPRILVCLDQLSPYGKRRYVWVDCESDFHGVWHLADWTLGYALSVHKAQGSEARHVIVALSEEGYKAVSWRVMNGSAPFLTRNMLYTAVTRAKESVRIIGSLIALQACLDTPYYYCNVRLAEALDKA